jgi:hypothetical protein
MGGDSLDGQVVAGGSEPAERHDEPRPSGQEEVETGGDLRTVVGNDGGADDLGTATLDLTGDPPAVGVGGGAVEDLVADDEQGYVHVSSLLTRR